MIGSQSGSVMSATSTSPGTNSCMSATVESTRTAPAPIFWPMARPSINTEPRSSRRKRCRAPVLRRDCTVSGRAWRMYS